MDVKEGAGAGVSAGAGTASRRRLMTTAIPTLAPSALPSSLPTVVRGPDHEFDFRGCSDSSATADTGFNGTGITATAKNGANCSAEGMVFDGSDDYVDVTPWLFGGKPMTVEAYVKRDSASGNYDRILQFSDAVNAEAVVLSTDASSVDTVEFKVLNSGWKRGVSDANEYPTNTWVHIVGTAESDSTVKIYVDGDVQPTTGSSGIPTAKLREYHTFGAPNPESPNAEQFDGTIAFLRFWHCEALDADQVAELYAAREAGASTRRARRLQGSAERAAAVGIVGAGSGQGGRPRAGEASAGGR